MMYENKLFFSSICFNLSMSQFKSQKPWVGGWVRGSRWLRSPILPAPRIWNRRGPGRSRRANEGPREGPHPPLSRSPPSCQMISHSKALLPLYSFLQNVPGEQDATICNTAITPTQLSPQRKTAPHLFRAPYSRASPTRLENMHPSDSSSDVGLQAQAPRS